MSLLDENCSCSHSDIDTTFTEYSEDQLSVLADFFKNFGDKTRIRILFLLKEQELCVCDLAQALDMTSPAISHQLRLLKINRLVKSRRQGKSMMYSLDDQHIAGILIDGMNHTNEMNK